MKSSTISTNSLGRGLAVLVSLNELLPATVTRLVAATGLPKPTLLRILSTLVAQGYAIKQPVKSGGGYAPTPKVRRLSSAFAHGSALMQVAQPLLSDLAQMVKWPTDLLVRDGLSMLIEASNRPVAPITLRQFEQRRFPMLSSAAGQIYLAHLEESERIGLVTAALSLNETVDSTHLLAEQVYRWIDEARNRGYGIRDYDAPIQGTRAFSVPVSVDGQPIAALTMITLGDAVHPEHLTSHLIPTLQATAAKIAHEYSCRSNGDAP